ncbi:hypothetical protein A2U01_0079970, partial [Trifolium medium]|nr:hypothetical protein [Trifolium medium]
MAPKKPTSSASKKQKMVASSSQPSQDFEANRFLAHEHFESYKVLAKRKIWNERIFDIHPEGEHRRFADIIDNRKWDKLIN